MPNSIKQTYHTHTPKLQQKSIPKNRALKADPVEQTGNDKILWREQKNTRH